MELESTEPVTVQGRALSVGIIVAGVALGLFALAIRVAGALDLPDSATLPSAVYEHGRLDGSRSAVLALWSLILLSSGVRGLVRGDRSSVLVQAGGPSAAVAAVALFEGLWVIAAVSAGCALATVVWHRADSGSGQVPSHGRTPSQED